MEALKGKVAVVTGGSEGIGEAVVKRLAAEGMKVAALARRIEKLTDLENELRGKGYTVNGYLCDVQRESSVKDAFDRIEEDFGGIHILVNNAGIAPLVDMMNINLENTAAILNTNVLGPMSCIKEALILMKSHSILDGHIVNINSIAGHRAPIREHAGVYGASKHALRVLTESLRNDIIKHKLKTRVTSISPGLVRTSMTDYFRMQHPDWPSLIAENIADALVYAITVPPNVNELENDLKGKGHIVKGYICDVQNESDVKAAFKSIEVDFGPITILVNNAGVSKPISLDDINLENVNTILNTNVVGVLACTKEGLASMKKHSVDRGHIVTINSVAGHRDIPIETFSVYTASKKAVTSLCANLRNHLKPSKIRVTSISPGLVKTTMTKSYFDRTPDLHHLLPSDVAEAVIYAISAPLNVNVSEVILDNI